MLPGPEGIVVLCCGGRDYENELRAIEVLSDLPPESVVVHGDAPGADRLSRDVALALGHRHRPYPADWDAYGLAAGFLRNQQMLDENPDISLAIAFPGGKGTADMCRRLVKAGIPIIYVTD